MIKSIVRSSILTAALVMAAAMANARDYQVTGHIKEMTADKIVVHAVKSDETWEVTRDKDTKDADKAKVGDKVTIKYKMTATSIEVKDAAKENEKK